MKKDKLRQIVEKVVTEAAAEGKFQNYARGTFASMIKKASMGGNKNSPPFTDKASKPGKSGPDDSQYIVAETLDETTKKVIQTTKNKVRDTIETVEKVGKSDHAAGKLIRQLMFTDEKLSDEEMAYLGKVLLAGGVAVSIVGPLLGLSGAGVKVILLLKGLAGWAGVQKNWGEVEDRSPGESPDDKK